MLTQNVYTNNLFIPEFELDLELNDSEVEIIPYIILIIKPEATILTMFLKNSYFVKLLYVKKSLIFLL